MSNTSNVPTLLRIDASARSEGSFSRRIADAVETRWRAAYPHGRVIRRDLAARPIAHIDDATIRGYYTPAADLTPELRAATALSDALIAELETAHTVLIASPIYNFSVPSALKAWIDQVVRIGHTFAYENHAFRGLLDGPRAVLALAYGAGGYAGPLRSMDFLRPYLEGVLRFIGIEQIDVLAGEATTADAATANANLDAARAGAASLFAPALRAAA